MQPIRIGTVTNPYAGSTKTVPVVGERVKIKFPSRLNAMAIDPSKVDITADGRYSAGEVVFSVDLCKTATVMRSGRAGQLTIDPISRRPTLIRHAVFLMRRALGVNDGLHITVDNQSELRHVGLGSSSGLITGIAAAINELYGNPLPRAELLRYLAHNHVEEIDGVNDKVMPVQCLGGSGAAILFNGGVLVVAGESTVIASAKVDRGYAVLIGIPSDYVEKDAQELMEAELLAMPKFVHTGRVYGPQIAYNILHRMLPAMAVGDLAPVGDVVYDYRYRMGSIDNCSFVYDGLTKVAEQLKPIKNEGLADVLALSSVGPGFFVITKQAKLCKKIMKDAGLSIISTRIHNAPYRVLERH